MTEAKAYEIFSRKLAAAYKLRGGNAVRQAAEAEANDWYRAERAKIAQ